MFQIRWKGGLRKRQRGKSNDKEKLSVREGEHRVGSGRLRRSREGRAAQTISDADGSLTGICD